VVERSARAGWPGGFTDDELMALSVLLSLILCAVLTIGAVIFDPILAPVGFIGLLLGPGLVSMKLGNMGSARDRDVTRVMPFVLDLLVLTMRAGASMTIAMDRVAQDYRRHPVGEEFRATLKDIEMGTTAKQAFHGLAARVPTRVIRGFVDEVIQSEELGRPIADTLERLSDRVRVTRVQEANVAAGSAKVMVLIPGMLVFIATLLLLFAPFAVKFYYGGIGLE
jgi:tight adherence protein C